METVANLTPRYYGLVMVQSHVSKKNPYSFVSSGAKGRDRLGSIRTKENILVSITPEIDVADKETSSDTRPAHSRE